MRLRFSIAASAALALGACSEGGQPIGPEGEINIAIGAKTFVDNGFADACFDVRVITVGDGEGDGAEGGGGNTIYEELGDPGLTYPADKTTLCMSDLGQFAGTGQQMFSTVLPCVAGPTLVQLEIDSLWEYDSSGELVRVEDYYVPYDKGGWVRPVDCEARADVLAPFDVEIARKLDVGFVDVMVKIGDVACSAKFDCTDYSLLSQQDGTPVDTAVMAVACTGVLGDEVHLNLTEVAITCGLGGEVQSKLTHQLVNKQENVVYGFGYSLVRDGDVESARAGFYTNLATGERTEIELEKGETFVPVVDHVADVGGTLTNMLVGYQIARFGADAEAQPAFAYFIEGQLTVLAVPSAPRGRLLGKLGDATALVQDVAGNRSTYNLAQNTTTALALVDAGGQTFAGCGKRYVGTGGLYIAQCESAAGDFGLYAWTLTGGVVAPIALGAEGYTFSGYGQFRLYGDRLYYTDGVATIFWPTGQAAGTIINHSSDFASIVSTTFHDDYIEYRGVDENGDPIAGIHSPINQNGIYLLDPAVTFSSVRLGNEGHIACSKDGLPHVCDIKAGEPDVGLIPITIANGINLPTLTEFGKDGARRLPGLANLYNIIAGFDGGRGLLQLEHIVELGSESYTITGARLIEPDAITFLAGASAGSGYPDFYYPIASTKGGPDEYLPANLLVAPLALAEPDEGLFSIKDTFTLDGESKVQWWGANERPWRHNAGLTDDGSMGKPETYLAAIFGLPDSGDCTFTTTIYPSEYALPTDTITGKPTSPATRQVPLIEFDIPLTEDGERICGANPLGGDGSGVQIRYSDYSTDPSKALGFCTTFTMWKALGEGGEGAAPSPEAEALFKEYCTKN